MQNKITLFPLASSSRGSALLIVLAFLLLLTTLTVAFLSRATMERQLSNSSYGQNKTDLVAQGSIASILADLQQEIIAGSNGTGTPTMASGYYYPTSPLTAPPALAVPSYTASSIVGTGMENLVKVSKSGQAFWPTSNYTAVGPSRASVINTSTPSLNNRSITAARWNAPLLLARSTPTSTTDNTPVTTFPTPDWIYVARDGTNPTSTTWNSSWAYLPNVAPTTTPSAAAGTNPITQRYAYAIYNEGGTLDMNVAGSPVTGTSGSPATVTYTQTQPFKNALSYADITQLPYLSLAAQSVVTGSSTTLTASQQALLNNAIVGWRNNFSAYVKTGSFPGTATAYTFQAATSPSVLTPFDQNIVFNPAGFLSTGGIFGPTTLQPGSNLKVKNGTDNAFSTRQQLIQFFTQGLGQNSTFTTSVPLNALINVLQYLGTFSRDINQPSYAPPPGRPVVLPLASGGNTAVGADATVNPSLLSVTVQSGKTFTRNDGTTAVVGEPLIKKRFALNRLAWLTWEGPSASLTQTDTNIKALIADGIPWTYLQQGTAANIKAYFGLTWDAGNHVWDYNVHNGASGSGTQGAIMQLGAIASLNTPHEPDFFEILKATIGVGSLGKALAYNNSAVAAAAGASQIEQPANYNYYVESSVDIHVIQIGANIIAQAQPAYYPPQIVFDDGSGKAYVPRTIVGGENLPYLTAVMNGVLTVGTHGATSAPAPTALPRSGPPFTGALGSGSPGSSGYVAGDAGSFPTTANPGVGAWMQLPVIWNPYDPSSPVGVVGPTSFRAVADSAPPDVVLSGGSYNSFFVYAQSLGVGQGNNYSYAAASTSPGYSWYGDSALTGNSIKHQFINPSNAHGNAEIDFTVTPASTPMEICPEPMILMRPTPFTQASLTTLKDSSLSNANSIGVTVPSTHLMRTDPAVSSLVTGGGLPNYLADAPQFQAPEFKDPAATPYIGFYLGAFPLAWINTSGTPCSAAQSGAVLARYGLANTPAGDPTSCYMTYRMQYQDPNNASNWITYDTKYGLAYDGNPCALGVCSGNSGALVGAADWGFATDPRTSRFGLMSNGTTQNSTLTTSAGQGNPLPGPELISWGTAKTYAAGWLDTLYGLLYTTRPDGQSGFYCRTGWPSAIGPSSGWMAYISSDSNPAVPGIAPGLLSQNNTDIYFFPRVFYGDSYGAKTQTPNYFADADGVVRRGMGAFVSLPTPSSPEPSPVGGDIPPADTTVGLPMARAFNWTSPGGFPTHSANPGPTTPNPTITNYTGTAYSTSHPLSQAQSRPYFLHRPFYTVAELGYVFSDTPWRNLDFFTAESGNVALLDAFCVNDTNDPAGLVAGKVDLNTRQAPVLAAVIGTGCFDPVQPTVTGSGTVGQIDSTTAGLVAKALVARTTDTANLSNGTGPLQNVSDLIGKWQKNLAINDLGSLITGVDKGTLASGSGFYDGKLSYAGFSGGVWDTTHHQPYPNYTPGSVTTGGGVENFSAGATQSTSSPEDVYSAFMASSKLVDTGTTATYHNGPQETVGYIQRFREAPIRALAAVGTTRVWNLMIDVIAQTGRFPSSASSLANFNVEGERRYWVHVAIDRYTGKVLDEQIEEVKE